MKSTTGYSAILMAMCFLAAGAAADEPAKIRGMTISCPTWGWEWGTDAMVLTMEELRDIGVNWITIHPYAQILADGRVSDRFWRDDPDPEWLTRPIAEAHRLGLEILIKPHLAYWGSPFRWRGEIAFRTDEEWERFFSTYEQWLVWLVRTCEEADAFVVGTELDKTVRFEDDWRHIIERVREETDMHLTYAATWSAFESVPFWDALDVIGIQWYFPVAETAGVPDREELDRSWDRLIATVGEYADRYGKKVVLTELGYNRSVNAAVRPWEYRSGGDDAGEVQRRCLSAALDAIERSDSLVGAFLWKWFPGSRGGHNFKLSTPEMRKLIASHWED